MRTAAVILVSLFCCRPGAAQSQPAAAATTKDDNQLSPTVRLYTPKYMSVSRAHQVAAFVGSVLSNSGAVQWDDVPQALVIRGRSPAELDTAEALVKRFDVPGEENAARTPTLKRQAEGPDLDCVVYLIRASHALLPTGPNALATSPVPAELQSVVDELKHNFGYEHYALWDMQLIRASGEFQGVLPEAPGVNQIEMYNLVYKGIRYPPQSLAIDSFEFSLKSNALPDGFDSHIKTSINIREGQKLVLGKIRLSPADDTDLFLVLTTKPR